MARSGVIAVAVLCMAAVTMAAEPWMSSLHKQENENRGHHGVKPLTLNPELSKMAQAWADNLAKDCAKMSHAPKEVRMFQGKTAGENIYTGSLSDAEGIKAWALENAPNAANKWYGEIKDYPWPEFKDQTLPPNVQIGHFTQQVWKGSEQVGYGMATKDGCNRFYVVGRYWPAGNMKGSYGANVLPKSD